MPEESKTLREKLLENDTPSSLFIAAYFMDDDELLGKLMIAELMRVMDSKMAGEQASPDNLRAILDEYTAKQ